MTIVGLTVGALVILFGLRLVLIASQTALGGKILVRRGVHTEWRSVPSDQAWKKAFQDGLMGVLLLALGVFMMI